MSSMLQDSQLTDEVEVVWLEDPSHLDYVRQALDKVSQRRGKPRYSRDGRLVGYTNLCSDAERDTDSGLFARRAFFLLPHDRDSDPTGDYQVGAPGEAVDPSTIEPGRTGAKTPRSQRGRAAETTPAR
ncbi:hypothetical protein QFZ63_000116 [Streptomyces sp. B3I7]|uniref:DUF6009 family protein n=1 Tax=Streptomyces sp. B3I7 TaxID=3042269 RepID=UPI00278884BD|nr:DUF6009 family protein [Streptomyces sp. B3I7]MDQ0808402.1 hypothetical protein [Streptomyces sp. B3I7]